MSKYNKKGFSLIGVILAVFITSVGIVGMLDLSQTSLKAATLSKTRLIASGLAQEGVEVVRYTRRAQMEWDDWYDSVSSGNYLVQYNNANLLDFLVFSETPLRLNAGSGLYQYDAGANSPFYRKVTLTKWSSTEVRVIVEIKWLEKGNWHKLTVEDRLLNWK